MKLSIIIVSWNVCGDVLRCLDSIYQYPPSLSYEIIMVDNASADDTCGLIAEKFPNVRLVANGENRGFAAANNQGIKIAQGQYVLLVNPDSLVHRESLDVMIKELDKDVSIGACGPMILNPDGSVQVTVGGEAPSFRSVLYGKTIFRKLGLFRKHYKTHHQQEHNPRLRTYTRQLSGAAVMIRSKVFEEVGLLDEHFFMYYEDTDLFYRISQAGWKLLYLPDACITHFGGQSSQQISVRKKLLFYQSLFIFLRKHYGRTETFFFSLVFKPAFFLRILLEGLWGLLSILVFLVLRKGYKAKKASLKVYEAGCILGKYFLSFLLL